MACVVSNTAAAGIIIPIGFKLGQGYELQYIVPCVAVTALAFITPAGTPALALLHMRTQNKHIGNFIHIGLPVVLVGFLVIYLFGACWIAWIIRDATLSIAK